ncbi:hypothetical protein CARUB_v10006912mg [Capsella rubella]|uniref:Neprosin PEP catalytic domain-containing protein n=1 Tax=Capsella rubella TaxID=81985 RepID=R0F9N2_9BRAS|nr:uncharacterized protein LOC17879767 [Capsella rubella]EOA18381.1 hypothetical protein CARUB_v10006912mg [Capsella rubella]
MAFYWLLCLFICFFSYYISPSVQRELEYECVDIYKQPAFQHPSMKDHQIQMRPSAEFLAMLSMEPEPEVADLVSGTSEERCPKGQVPIHRPQINYTNNFIHPEKIISEANLHYAIIKPFDNDTTTYGGASALFNIYKPRVLPNQFSKAWVWLNHRENDTISSIQFGWAVHTGLYADDRPRLTTFWISNRHQTGCYNAMCRGGYVQVHKTIYPGMVYDKVSVINKKQYATHLLVGQDTKTKNWLLMTKKTLIGYWQSHIYSMERVSKIYFGGYAGGPYGATSPPMGSGFLPRQVGFRDYLGCYMKQLKIFFDDGLYDIDSNSFEEYVNSPKCYDVWFRKFELGSGEMLTFGGPGGQCGMTT